jgi:uncharacterized protein involved in response to NO
MLGIGALSPYLVMAIDCSFLTAVGIMTVLEIIAGRNWRNLKVIIPVLLFLAANILFHTEVIMQGNADYGRRMGFAVILFLITLIGGRIIPSFTRNWLVKSNPGTLPTPFGRFDVICLILGGISLTSWVILPQNNASNLLLILSALLHFVRLLRWCGIRTIRSPVLLILHIAYGFIPLGFFITGLGLQTSGIHLLGIGAIGGMTVAVMIRAALGHTGRPLHIKASLIAAFILLIFASITRSLTPHEFTGLMISTGLWTLGMGMVLIHISPWLWAVKLNQRTPNS